MENTCKLERVRKGLGVVKIIFRTTGPISCTCNFAQNILGGILLSLFTRKIGVKLLRLKKGFGVLKKTHEPESL